eukprot:1158623-Pelagomonas_calceolata.AAC.9
MNADVYWRMPYKAIASSKQLTGVCIRACGGVGSGGGACPQGRPLCRALLRGCSWKGFMAQILEPSAHQRKQTRCKDLSAVPRSKVARLFCSAQLEIATFKFS